ncbi:uncharacterized protein LOC132752064 [Ruditapes philippinarum]|uniref:uncharacterized protein LOC132752064 n=1 Tax=Ruditapes philippinarum TaxID=129788 RepID=UPI00295C174D|nr:uncharacterized protein LOC132752064 [Ruditapes philippinarum]
MYLKRNIKQTDWKWITIFLLFYFFKLVESLRDTHLAITNSQCGKTYSMSWRKSAYLEYYGSVILSSSPCSIEFTNEETTDYILCISTLEISINCGTELEFHEHYVKSYFTPEKRILCHNATVNEWCSSEYVQNVFVVIRKPSTVSSDYIRLRVVRKERSGGFWRSGLNIFLVALAPAVLICIVSSIVCTCWLRKKKRERRDGVVQYQTSSAAVVLPSTYLNTLYQPSSVNQSDHPVSRTNQLPASYQIHAMQIATPIYHGSQQPDSNQPLIQPTAPPPNEDAPPCYESLMTG